MILLCLTMGKRSWERGKACRVWREGEAWGEGGTRSSARRGWKHKVMGRLALPPGERGSRGDGEQALSPGEAGNARWRVTGSSSERGGNIRWWGTGSFVRRVGMWEEGGIWSSEGKGGKMGWFGFYFHRQLQAVRIEIQDVPIFHSCSPTSYNDHLCWVVTQAQETSCMILDLFVLLTELNPVLLVHLALIHDYEQDLSSSQWFPAVFFSCLWLPKEFFCQHF